MKSEEQIRNDVLTTLQDSSEIRANARRITGNHELRGDLISEALIIIASLPVYQLIEMRQKGPQRLIGYVTMTMHNMWRNVNSDFNKLYRPTQERTVDYELDPGAEDAPEMLPDGPPLIHSSEAIAFAQRAFKTIRLSDEHALMAGCLLLESDASAAAGRYPVAAEWSAKYIELGSYRKIEEWLEHRVSHVSIRKRIMEFHDAIRTRMPEVTRHATDAHADIQYCLALKRMGVAHEGAYYVASGEAVPAFDSTQLMRAMIGSRTFMPMTDGRIWWSGRLLTNACGVADSLANLAAKALLFSLHNGLEQLPDVNERMKGLRIVKPERRERALKRA